jgi:cysteine desulfurase/selenocysteine lyase
MTVSTAEKSVARPARDLAALRNDFPALHQLVHGKPLAYLDNAASSQSPVQVHEAMAVQQRLNHSNVHRGVHALSERSTAAFEGAREKVRRFINAASTAEIVFTRGTTESINLVAASFGQRLGPGDEVLITWLEHHSNIVPWQLLCERTGARLVVAPIRDDGSLDVAEFERLLGERTKIVAVAHVSNALGTLNPVAELVAATSTARRPYRTCASTSQRSIATSTRSRATRCSAPRARACSTANARCSSRCRRIRAAAT